MYWVLKVLLLRRMAIKKAISAKLLVEVVEIMKLGILCNAVMAFIFFTSQFNHFSVPSVLALIVAGLFTVLPVKRVLIKFFVKGVERDKNGTYFDVYKTFKHYDLQNPITKSNAISRLEGNSLRDAIRR